MEFLKFFTPMHDTWGREGGREREEGREGWREGWREGGRVRIGMKFEKAIFHITFPLCWHFMKQSLLVHTISPTTTTGYVPEVMVVLDLPSVSSLPTCSSTLGGTQPASELDKRVRTYHLSSNLLSMTSTRSPFFRTKGVSPSDE